MNLNDVSHYWGSDLGAGVTGDLALSSATVRGQQRVLRRLLTNPGDYIFHPDYGAGLPMLVGKPLDSVKIAALIRSQILLEAAVAQTPAPQITVRRPNQDPTAIAVEIAYQDAATSAPIVLAFNVKN